MTPDGPPVRSVERKATTDLFVPLAIGFAISAIVVTALFAAAGTGLGSTNFAAPAAIALLVALALFELTPFRKTLLYRQTPGALPSVFGPRLGVFAWGLDTGAMLTTFRTSTATYATVGLCLLGFGGPWSGVAYALGFCLPLGLALYRTAPPACAVERPPDATPRLFERLVRHIPGIRLAAAALMLTSALTIVAY